MKIFLVILYVIGTVNVSNTSARNLFSSKNVKLGNTRNPRRIISSHPNNLVPNKVEKAKPIIISETGTKEDEQSKRMFPEAYSGLFEGDIIVPMGNRNALSDANALWPNGVVPYIIEPMSFDPTAMFMITEAMNRIQARTCINFVPAMGEGPHVKIGSEKPNACYSVIGYQPGFNVINFGDPSCFNFGTLQHELLHTLGLHHEHNRVDRDQYLDINMKNVDEKFVSQFDKPLKEDVTTFNLPYDYLSVMHYPRTAFSLNNKPTMTAKGNFQMELGNREGPTPIDIEKINLMYNCNQIRPVMNPMMGTMHLYY